MCAEEQDGWETRKQGSVGPLVNAGSPLVHHSNGMCLALNSPYFSFGSPHMVKEFPWILRAPMKRVGWTGM